MADGYDPQAIEAKWQAYWAEHGTYEVDNDDPRPHYYTLCMYPYPSGCGAHGPRAQLHLRRPHRPPPHDERLRRAVADGLRHASGSRPRTRPSRPVATPASSPTSASSELRSSILRIGAVYDWRRAGHQPRPRVHQRWTQWIFLRFLEAGLAYRQERPGQLVSRMPDGAGQRAGPGRRHVRALGRPGREARPRAVVLQDHRLRRAAARRPRRPRLARAGQDHAAQLDRPLRGRRVRHGGHRRRRHAPARRARRSGCSPPGPTPASA